MPIKIVFTAIAAVTVIVAVLSIGFVVLADGNDDQDWARDAVLSGEAVPLAQIIDSIERAHDGKVYEVDLLKSDDSRGVSMYRLKLVSDDGFLMDLMVDASSGQLIGIGGQGIGNDDHHDDDDGDEKEHDD